MMKTTIDIASIPPELAALPQWVMWKFQRRGDDKPTKVPYCTDGRPADCSDSETWSSLEAAIEALATGKYDGIGFEFAEGGGMVGTDLDDCLNDGELKAWAVPIVTSMQGTYAEVSPSGNGIKFWARGTLPTEKTGGRKFVDANGNAVKLKSDSDGALEMYQDGRYFTFTGNRFDDAPLVIAYKNVQVHELFNRVFSVRRTTPSPRTNSNPGSGGFERCRKYVAKMNPSISGAGGHDAAFAVACVCFRFGLSDTEARQVFEQFNARCSPPWSEREIEHKLDSAKVEVEGNGEFGVMLETQRQTNSAARTTSPSVGNDLHLTDLGTSERFDDEHGRDLRYCPSFEEWRIFDGRRWAPDATMEVERRAALTVRGLYAFAATIADSSDRAAVVAFAKASEKRERLAAVPALARQRLTVTPDQFDRDNMKLNVENGTVNLRTGELLHHDRNDLLTCLAPVVYDANADCPLWLSFLHRVMAGNERMISYLQRLCGYFITGETGDQIFPIPHGEGANGKSVFMDTLMGIMGDYARVAPDSLLTASARDSHPTEIAMLKGARLVVGSETEEGRKLRIQLVKKMTGDKTMVGRWTYGDFFEFTRTHKTVLVTNNKPVVTEAKNAIWRRIRLIPFTVRIPVAEQDQQLLTKLRREWSGILAWMVRGCLEWQRIGLNDPPEVGIATNDYRAEQDRIAAFVDDCLYPVNEANWTSRKAIREAYVQWVHRTGERTPLEPAGLYDRLTDVEGIAEKFGTENGKRTRGFSGVALLPGSGE